MSSSYPRGHDLPVWSLEIENDDGTERVPLPKGMKNLIESIQVHQVWDGADSITISAIAWDGHKSDFVWLQEETLAPGKSVIFRAGYGRPSELIGRFDIVEHNPTMSVDGARVEIVGYDAFHLLMDDTYPGDYGSRSKRDPKGGGIRTYDDVAKIVARRWGWGFVGDTGARIPFKKRTVKVRKRSKGKVVKDANGKAVLVEKTRHSRIVKNAGDTDAKFLKKLANLSGFLGPKIRYVERLPRDEADTYDVVENVTRNNVLFFVRADLQRQLGRTGVMRFDYALRDENLSTLEEFSPGLRTKGIPMAVRVSGLVRTGGRRRVVTVEAELTGPAQLRRRNAYLRRAARETDPKKKADFLKKAERIRPQYTIESYTKRRRDKRDKKKYRRTGRAMLEVLGADKKPTKTYSRAKKRKVQTVRREVIGYTQIATDKLDLVRLARGWLAARLGSYINATAATNTLVGTEKLYPNQVHEFRSVPWDYQGIYMIRVATHTWALDGTHRVTMELNKVSEPPPWDVSLEED